MSIQPPPTPPAPAARELWSHEFLDALTLAYYSAMARRVQHDPSLVQAARERLHRWLHEGGYDASQIRALREWQPFLEEHKLSSLLRLMTDPGEDATRMRQSGPFAGVLTAAERKAIKEQLKTRWLHGTL